MIIDKFLPIESTDAANKDMFRICFEILESQRFKEESTQQLLVTALIKFAEGENERKQLLQWFDKDDIIGSTGQVLQ